MKLYYAPLDVFSCHAGFIELGKYESNDAKSCGHLDVDQISTQRDVYISGMMVQQNT